MNLKILKSREDQLFILSKQLVLITTLITLLNSSLLAEDIYSWTDEEGRTHFSNTPKDEAAKTVKLPDTDRYSSDERIKAFQKEVGRTCLNNGGVQCSLGEDIDGSVICADGSRNSEENFKKHCTEVKLIAEIEKPAPRNTKQILKIPLKSIVRNVSSHAAKGVTVKVKIAKTLSSDEYDVFELEGPYEIQAFEQAEYTFTGKLIDDRLVRKANISVDCDNCLKAAAREASNNELKP